jgi:hypothetical protein
MKQVHLLFAIIAISASVGCKSFPDISFDDNEYITLSLGVSGAGETKGTSTANIYGIEVSYDSNKDGNINAHYAYGLFDNIEDMTILLLKGYKYSFVCSMVKNGKNTLYSGQYEGNTFTGYAKPFQREGSPSTALSNRFIYISEDNQPFSGLGSGTATIKASSGYEDKDMPSIERYYGEYSNYTPVSGDVVTIPLIKTIFGIRLIIEKVPEGTLWASCAGGLVSGSASSTDGYDSGACLFCIPDVAGVWRNADSYSENKKVNWKFTSSLFDQYNFGDSRQINIKRNILTTVTVSYTPDNASGGLSLNYEDLAEDNDIYLFVNSDGYIEIGINPEPED